MVKIYFKDLKNKKIIKLLRLIEKEKPQKTDAIIWLQGDRYDRGKKVLFLFKRGFANQIVVSGNNKLIGPNKRKGENNISLKEMVKWLRKRGIRSNQIIVENKSFNTKDQAKNVLKLIQQRKWKKIILVTSSYHQLRALLTFLKMAKKIRWKGVIINQPVKISWEKIPSGRKKKCKELFMEEIEKIKKYQNDVADVEDAILYMKTKHV
jgi:uncharacterized SAM-binding protein YcdF (DUF218 family)